MVFPKLIFNFVMYKLKINSFEWLFVHNMMVYKIKREDRSIQYYYINEKGFTLEGQ